MRTVSCWNDLRHFGFDVLTGEACGLGMRLLVDINKQAAATLRAVLDVKEISFKEQWNSGEKVGCIMLPHDFLGPIAIFALLRGGYDVVWQCKGGTFHGMGRGEEKEYKDQEADPNHAYSIIKAMGYERSWSFAGTAGDRNVHQMSGRAS